MNYENQSFKVAMRQESGCQLFFTVEIKPERVKKAYKEAVKTVNKEISLPGFRKGKAPEEAVIKQYAPHIEKEWKELVVNEALQGAIELTKIYPYSRETIGKPKLDKCSLEEGAIVHLNYESYPQIPEINFSEITLPKTAADSVPQKAIDDVLGEIQKANANWEDVPARAVQEGDFVDISIDKIDEEPAKQLVRERRFEVSSDMMPWLKNMVIGMEAGQTLDGQTGSEKEDAAPIKVRVLLHSIKKIILPTIDDELAKKAGAESHEDLLSKIRSNLESDEEIKHKEKKIRSLEEIILEKYPFDIPNSILNAEVDHRYETQVKQLRQEGLSEEMIEARSHDVRQEVKAAALNALKLHFLLNKIGEREKIHLTNEELSEKLRGEMMQNPYYFDLQKKNPEMFSSLIRRLSNQYLFEKIRDHMLAQIG